MNPWRLAHSLEQLRTQVNTLAPGRSKASDGTIGDAAHAASVSDHNPDAAGVVRAFDITHDPAHGLDGTALAGALVASRDPRIKYVIWNHRMARSYPKPGIPAWSWAAYTGQDPHTNHVHLSVVADARADATTPWKITPTTPAQEDDMFTDKDRELLGYISKQVKATAQLVIDKDNITAADLAALVPDTIAADVVKELTARLAKAGS